ncbi:MAG: response regulator, partial [Lentisphaeria bacterium]|nr:response regulator [Lentisphaeria bacterium]
MNAASHTPVPAATKPTRILIVDDDEAQQRLLQHLLKTMGYQVTGTLSSGTSAVSEWQNHEPDVILMDIMMEEPEAGILAGEQIGEKNNVPIIYLTATEEESAFSRALRSNPHGYLAKPVSPAALKSAIEVSLVRHKYENQLVEYRKKLERSEQLFRGIFTNLRIGYFRITPGHRVELLNPFLLELLEVPEGESLIGENLRDLVAPEAQPHAFLNLEDQDAQETVWCSLTGKTIPVKLHIWPVHDASGGTIFLEGTVEDMTRANTLRNQMMHAQKMEVIGTLSGRVSHEINNRLTSVLGHSELIMAKVEPGTKLEKYARSVVQNARSASDIIRQLLTFTREWGEDERTFDIRHLVKNMLDLLQHVLGRGIELLAELPQESILIKGNPKAVEQALFNIAMNARDAMPDGGEFTLRVEKSFQDGTGVLSKSIPTGAYVKLSLTDTGIGMTETIQKQLFAPFFTTKDENISTGLGLSVVQRIMDQMNGHIQVESAPGEGARFDLYF